MGDPSWKRVAVVIDSLSPGGAERIAIEAAAALDPERYRALLLVTRSSGPLHRLADERGIPVVALERRRGFSPGRLARALRIVAGCDLVHAHLWGSAMWSALLAQMTRRPLVAHVHRYDGDVMRGWTAGYRLWIAPQARRVVCVSAEIADRLARGGVPRHKLAVIENGVWLRGAVDPGRARSELGLDDRPAVGMIARLRPEKRHDRALRAIAELRTRGLDVTLVVVGDGDEGSRLRALARELGIADLVRWAGAVPDAGRLVRAFDAILITSEIEGMPLAALEALVEGVPVVATAVGALPSLLEGGGGLLVEPDAVAIADAVAQILAAPRDSRDATASASRARERYGIDRVARELEAVYDAALARP